MEDLSQDIVRRGLDQLERSHARLAGDIGALQRWVLAAMFGLNVAALLAAAVMHGSVALPILRQAAGYFLIGAGACILAAIAGLLFNLATSRAITHAIPHWTEAGTSGDLPEEAVSAASGIRTMAARGQISMAAFGLGSIIAFLAGAITLAGISEAPDEHRAAWQVSEGRAPESDAGSLTGLSNASVEPLREAALPSSKETPAPEARPGSRPSPSPRSSPAPRSSPTPQPTSSASPAPAPRPTATAKPPAVAATPSARPQPTSNAGPRAAPAAEETESAVLPPKLPLGTAGADRPVAPLIPESAFPTPPQ